LLNTSEEYEKALKRLGEITGADEHSILGEEVEQLCMEIGIWEEQHCGLPDPTLQDKIQYAIEQFGLEIIINMKGYKTIIFYNVNDHVFHGKIECISDLILFEGKTLDEACDAFVDAVGDYIELKK